MNDLAFLHKLRLMNYLNLNFHKKYNLIKIMFLFVKIEIFMAINFNQKTISVKM